MDKKSLEFEGRFDLNMTLYTNSRTGHVNPNSDDNPSRSWY